jgi:hypothetical protein
MRLAELLAKVTGDTADYPGLSDDEAAEVYVLAFGMDPIQAAEIVAIERGEIEGDVIAL